MGMSSGSRSNKAVTSDINVTPLIDVLLVLLIIFLVVMPIMVKTETLQVPRKLAPDEIIESTASQLTIKVKADLTMSFNDGSKPQDDALEPTAVASTLRPKLAALASNQDKVVFIELEDGVPWGEVVTTVDTIRSISTDINRDEIKIALKTKDAPSPD